MKINDYFGIFAGNCDGYIDLKNQIFAGNCDGSFDYFCNFAGNCDGSNSQIIIVDGVTQGGAIYIFSLLKTQHISSESYQYKNEFSLTSKIQICQCYMSFMYILLAFSFRTLFVTALWWWRVM